MPLSKPNILIVSGGWHYDLYAGFRNKMKYLVLFWFFGIIWVANLHLDINKHPVNSRKNVSLWKESQRKVWSFQACFWRNSGKAQGLLFRKSCMIPGEGSSHCLTLLAPLPPPPQIPSYIICVHCMFNGLPFLIHILFFCFSNKTIVPHLSTFKKHF